MDVYHKILVKLYEVTNGKTSERVDFVDLVKKEGFYPSYKDICSHLNNQGWIIELGRDLVNITHWGVKEARKVSKGGGNTQRELKKSINRLKAETKEMLVMTEELMGDPSEDSYKLVEAKFEDIKKSLGKVKENI